MRPTRAGSGSAAGTRAAPATRRRAPISTPRASTDRSSSRTTRCTSVSSARVRSTRSASGGPRPIRRAARSGALLRVSRPGCCSSARVERGACPLDVRVRRPGPVVGARRHPRPGALAGRHHCDPRCRLLAGGRGPLRRARGPVRVAGLGRRDAAPGGDPAERAFRACSTVRRRAKATRRSESAR